MKKKITFISVFIVLAILVSCSMPDSFDGVRWGTSFKIPVINKTYYAYELIDSEPENYTQLENGLMQFTYDTDLNSNTKIEEEDITIEGTSVSNVAIYEGSNFEFKIPLKDFQESFEFKKASIERCNLEIDYTQVEALNKNFTLEFIEIFDTNNSNLTITKPTNTFSDVIDLNGYYVETKNEEMLDSLTVRLSCEGTPANDIKGLLGVGFSQMVFNEIQGRVFDKNLDVEESVTNIDTEYPDNISNAIVMKQAFATITVTNEIGFAIKLNGTIEAENEEGEKAFLNLGNLAEPFIIPPAKSETEATVYSRDVAINNLMNIAPITLTTKNVNLKVLEEDEGFAKLGKGATGDMQGRVNFVFKLENEILRPADIDSLEVSKDNQDTITDYLKSAQLTLNAINGFPAGANLSMYFSTDKDKIYNQTTQISETGFKIDNLQILGSDDTSFSKNILDISLNEEKVAFFANGNVYYGLEIHFFETEDAVSVFAADSLKINGHIDLKVKIDTED